MPFSHLHIWVPASFSLEKKRSLYVCVYYGYTIPDFLQASILFKNITQQTNNIEYFIKYKNTLTACWQF